LIMDALYGQKLGMTRVFNGSGNSIGVTVIRIEPGTIVGVKSSETHGYNAMLVGFGTHRAGKLRKPVEGQFKKAGVEPARYLREIRIPGPVEAEVGSTIGADIFKPGEKVHITGISRGHGFQGTVKRYGFAGGPKTHGQSDRLRAPGSIGASSYPSRVFKGQRMAGHMGNRRATVKNLRVVSVEPDQSLILVEGPAPGHKNSQVFIRKVR
jgi:large subunit ribosomal protein L3